MITLLDGSENLLNLRDGVVVGVENLQRDAELLCSRFGPSGVRPLIIVISRNKRDQHPGRFRRGNHAPPLSRELNKLQLFGNKEYKVKVTGVIVEAGVGKGDTTPDREILDDRLLIGNMPG